MSAGADDVIVIVVVIVAVERRQRRRWSRLQQRSNQARNREHRKQRQTNATAAYLFTEGPSTNDYQSLGRIETKGPLNLTPGSSPREKKT